MILNLQSLRALGAILIFAHHFFPGTSPVVLSFGDCAVDIFIMLSGFVLTKAYAERKAECRNGKLWSFMRARLAHIYPLYFFGLALGVIIVHRLHISPGALALDTLMLQSWCNDAGIYFSGNSPAWFISDLMFCYILFLPILSLRRLRPAIFHSLLAVYATIYLFVAILAPAAGQTWALYIFPPAQLLPFIAGMLLAGIDTGKRRIGGNAAIPASAILCILCMFAYRYVPQRFALGIYWWLPSALLIYSFAAADSDTGPVTRILHLRPLVAAGDASFCIYILHWPWICATRRLMNYSGITMPIYAEFIISFIALAVISFAINRRIVIPLKRILILVK